MSNENLPTWVWHVVVALVDYEDNHDNASTNFHPPECRMRPHLCACPVTEHIPEDVARVARTLRQVAPEKFTDLLNQEDTT